MSAQSNTSPGADAPPTDFDEEAPTDVVTPGAFPEAVAEDGDDDDTTPRRTLCLRCLRPVKTAGDTRPTWQAMTENAPETCWRAMHDGWWWCSGMTPFQLVIQAPET